MGSVKNWTKEEIEYLNENWGMVTLSYLSKQLKRTMIGVTLKAKRMGFGPSSRADEYITASQVAVLLSVDAHTVERWIKKHNLKTTRKVLLFKKRFYLVKLPDLCKWLKNNQGRFDSRRIELYSFGHEPPWLKMKRIKDKELAKNRFKIWTKLEVQRLIINYKNMRYRKIAQLLDRSYDSIDRKVYRLRRQRIII
jgi:hypothetical protein